MFIYNSLHQISCDIWFLHLRPMYKVLSRLMVPCCIFNVAPNFFTSFLYLISSSTMDSKVAYWRLASDFPQCHSLMIEGVETNFGVWVTVWRSVIVLCRSVFYVSTSICPCRRHSSQNAFSKSIQQMINIFAAYI